MKKVDAMHRLGSLTGLATVMTLVGSAAMSAQPPAATQATAVSPQGYSVVLVLGDLQATSATDNNVPAAARKALADMKDFLPYKSYRLLDAQWILGSQRTVSRLRGPNDQEYELTLRGVPNAGKLVVTFRLAEPGAVMPVKISPDADSKGKRAELEKALREAEAEAAARGRGSSAEKRAETVGAAREKTAAILKELQQENALREAATRVGGRAVIDTSFTMDVGETVVVGTSRVAGDKALIALLTAVGRTGR